MNKQKQVKKTLVRNTEKPVSRCKVTVENSTTSLTRPSTESIISQKKPDVPIGKRCEVSEADLGFPELYSTLSISKKIDNVVKPKKIKSFTTVDKNLPLGEKATKKLNFPHDRPVYKNLISLTIEEPEAKPKPPRAPRPPRYKESILSDFLTLRQPAECCCTCDTDSDIEIDPAITTKDSLLLYRTMRNYDPLFDDE